MQGSSGSQVDSRHRRPFSKLLDIVSDALPISVAEHISKIAPLIPFYHMVSDEKLIHVCHLYSYKNEAQFTSDIEFLCGRYQPISLADLIDSVRHDRKLRNGSFLLTFDDGYSQMYSVVAPILIKKGIPAVFFLNTDFVDNEALFFKNKASIIVDFIINNEIHFYKIKPHLPNMFDVPFRQVPGRILSIKHEDMKILDGIAELSGICFNEYLKRVQPYLSSIQIRQMVGKGFYFGAHSLNHPLYQDLSLEDQVNQTIESLRFIKTKFNIPYAVFAFPHHDHLVTKRFFGIIKDRVDLTFGTAGTATDLISSNLQRINFENVPKSAKHILTHQFLKKWISRWHRKSDITRA